MTLPPPGRSKSLSGNARPATATTRRTRFPRMGSNAGSGSRAGAARPTLAPGSGSAWSPDTAVPSLRPPAPAHPLRHLAEQQRRVVAAEAEAVAHGVLDLAVPRLVRHVVQV